MFHQRQFKFGRVNAVIGASAKMLIKAPIHLYRFTLRPWLGWPCRHLPTCSDYALEAVDRNGAWKGFWLIISRLFRCHPFGTAGFDPVPDLRAETHPLEPWRYGRWSAKHIDIAWDKPTSKDKT